MKKRFLLTWFVLAFAVFAKAQTHWTAPSTMAYNMTGNAVVFVNGSSIMGSEGIANLELGVFKGDECRGCALPIVNTFPMTQGTYPYVYNMMLYSNSLTETGLTFRLYNHQTNEEECLNSSTTITFQSDGSIGNLVNPLQVQLVDAVCFYVTAEANPTAGGTVTGGGHIREGNSCTLTATAVGCYQFLNWTNGSEVVSTNASYTFTPTEDIAFVANFQANTFSITASVDPSESGTITGAGTYDCGATCTLNATPVVGYQFVNWTKGGVEVSTNAEYSFTVEEEGAYVAHFSMEPYVITATANPTEGGTVAVDGTLVHGTTCTLTATPAEHYVFVNWTLGGEVVSTNAAYSFTVTGDGAYVANFELASYEITATVNPAGAGTVTGAGTITYGQTCTLTATANGGYTFTNWTKGGVEVSTNATYSFTVEEAGAYVANFAPKTYTVTASANPTDGGIVTLSPEATSGSYSYGQQVRLRAIAKLGYNFVNWTKGGVAVSTESTFNITIGDDTEGAYVANFSMVDPLPAVPTETHWTFNENTQYSMIITGVMVLDGASVPNTIAPYLEIGAFVGDVCKGSFLAEYVNIPPLNVDGYFYQMTFHSDVASGEQLVFRVWDHINNVELDVTSLSNTNFVADANLGDLMNPHVLEFETNLTIHYNITATANPADGGTVTGSGSYEEETQCTLVATADSHYDFTNWTLNGQVVSSNPTYAFTATADGSYVANFTPKSYSVTVTTPVHGSVEGAGTYVYNTQCVLVATPDEGYHFVNWTKAGTVVSEELSYGFAVDGDAEFVATFAINTYDIVATPSPDATVAAGGGTVTGAGTCEHFATCTLIAIPANNRWVFENWTENDVVIEGATDTLSFEVTGPRTLVANFAPIFTITASADADIMVDNVEPGTIEGAGDIIKGRTWTLTETPDAGYTFVNWFEVINEERVFYSNETSISEEAQADRTFVAYYTLNSYDITTTVAPDAVPATATEITVAGTVTGDDTYHHYDTCTLVATPSTGYHFVNWTENDVEVATTATYEFVVTEGRTLVANFELDTHVITLSVADVTENIPEAAPAVPGTVTGADTYNYYATCTVVATPEVGYHFVNWTENGAEVATTATYEFMVEGDRDLVANFELDTHVIDVTVVDVTVDKPAAAPAVPGIVTGADTYNYYATCTLVATPEVGYHFVNWTEGGVEVETSATYEFMVTEDRALVANFELDTHVIDVTVVDVTVDKPEAAPAVPGTVTGADTYNYYATCTVVATPEVGYHFVNWTENGTEVSTSATYEFMVEGDRALVANFELDTHTIDVTVVDVTVDKPEAAPDVPGIVTGADTYNYYATCTLVATPEVGYHFVNWTEGGVEVETATTYEFMVTEDRALVANFELDTHTIILSVADVTENTPAAAPAVPGTVTGADTYNYYATCTVVATPEVGYHFVNWTENGTEVSASATYEFMITEDRNLVANFELDTHSIAVTIVDVTVDKPEAAPEVPGTVTGADTYNYYATCTLVATPEEGYHFVNWTENDVEVGTETTYEFMVTEDRALIANFELDTHTIILSVADVTENTPAAAPAVPGTVTGDGTYNYYATCTLVATPATGYHFVNWTESGQEVSTSATYEFMITEDRSLVANFELDTHSIAVTIVDVTVDKPEAAPAVPGTVTGADTYNYYATCTLVATPEEGYHFVNWTENGTEVATTATYEFMVEGDRDLVANFELDTHGIEVTIVDVTVDKPAAAPAVPGTVTGDGTYNYYATCTLVATPATGYHFVNWTENGTEVSASATYEFMVTEDRALVANFELDTHTITLSVADVTENIPAAAPAVPGTVTGDGTYNYYAMCTVVATPATGYHFVNWTENGTEVATTATYEFMVEGDRALVANFELDTHSITVSVADVSENIPSSVPAAPGTVTGDGTYNYYATCTLVATPATGYHFVNWTENGQEVSTSATYEFMITEDRTLVANFELDTHTITLSVADVTENIPAAAPSVPGTVTGDGTYNYYATCTLVATPATGYHFVNWTVNGTEVSASATYEFMVEGDRALVANFELDSYTIATSIVPAETPDNDPDPAGVVTGSGTYTHYSTCELTATANTGYTFVSWTLNGTVVSTDATYSFMVTGPATYVANFEINTYTITATDNPSGFGTITGAGTYEHFSTCTLTATAGEGHTFFNWSENDVEVSTTATYSFTVTGPRTLVAHFINRYVITVAANPTVGGTASGAGTYDEGTSVTLTATPATGYHFVNWTLNGNVVSTNATYTFTALAAGDYVANFEINNYAITAVANPTAGGVVTGAGNYDHFTTCTLTATANTGYTFLNWTKNGNVVSTNATYSFTVESAADFVANFQLNSYAITATLDPTDAGTVTGAGTYNHFETCTLTANPSSSYLFVNWTLNGTVVSTDLSISFEVTGPAAYVAHFIPNTYEITATAVPSYAGTVTGAGTYYYNTTCTLTATPNTGHHFLNWTKNGAVVSTDASISFTVTANEDYVAHFDANVYQVTLFTYPSVGGTVTGGGAYPYGQTCVIEAVANEGYSFVEWKLNDDEVISTTPTYMFNVTENVAFVAYFALNTYEITATANPADGGTVTGAGTYNYGESCTLTAAAAEGYTFVNWTLDGVVVSTSANYTFTVTESNDYVANFSLNSYEITATANPTEGGTVTGVGNYNYGASCTLTATPTTGYNFVNWTKNGTVVSTEASYSFTVTGAGAYVANFEIITFVITATVAPDGAGEVEGAGTYNYGATVTMTATAAEGYRFVNWTEGDEVVSVEETFTFTALSDRQLVAHFQSTVGVGETEWTEVSVYPNPATDKLYIKTHRQSSRCEIYTITGAMVYSQDDCIDQIVIEVSDFTAGAYIVRIISDSMVQNIRFIKQ